uniref:hypothetical protein n=1 Tax=Vibrio splendidus TaxID=29497 RepID=UPI003F5E87F6
MNTELLHWNYFLALEKKFVALAQYVEITEANYSTFSTEITQLYLATSSEVDVVAKQLCKKIAPLAKRKNIDDYRKILICEYPALFKFETELTRFNIKVTPWSSWENEQSPVWWKEHNDVKHDRAENFAKAKLKNLIGAMAGLHLLILALHESMERIEPYPIVFQPTRDIGYVAPTFGGAVAFFFNKDKAMKDFN